MPKKKTALTIEERLQQALVPAEEQPYEVPENWVWVRLESVASWGSGGTPSRKHEEYYNGDILWIKTGELNNGWIYDTEEKITDEGLKKSSAKLFPPYSVLIAMYGATIGKVAILGVPATTNQACACAVCNQSLLYMYLFYYCISQKNVFIEKGKGGAQPNISQIILKQHPIPLPPLSEQQRIVERIEELFAKLDEAKERLQEVADSFAVRKAAILHKAFTGELTKQWRRENGVSDESWEEKNLGDVCSKITDGTHNSPTNSLTGEYMYVTAKNIKDTGIDLSNITYVTKEIHKEIYSRCDVVYGDVLYIKDGATAGIATINTLKEEFSMLSSVALIRADLKLATNEFIKTYLNYRKKEILKNISGSAITRLTLSKIKNIAISLPTLPEQHEIVRLIDDLLARERSAQQATEQALASIDLMKKSILARAFRGELGTNKASEASALELLRQVLAEN
jgi:type I restriction enzyme S subunit